MKKGTITFILFTFFIFTIFISGCSDYVAQSSKSGATQVENVYKVPKNAKDNTCEQQNIMDRLKVTTDPTKIMWIHLIALDGTIIKRMPVRNKVTSSGKRLEPKHAAIEQLNELPNSGFLIPGMDPLNDESYYRTNEFIGPDGTFGDSDPYIFWFDPMIRYHQWGTAGGLGYLKTDYPIDLDNPVDLVTGLYNMHKAAREWQLEQEKKLEITEAKAKKEHTDKMKGIEDRVRKINELQDNKATSESQTEKKKKPPVKESNTVTIKDLEEKVRKTNELQDNQKGGN